MKISSVVTFLTQARFSPDAPASADDVLPG
jgi:hypothetical protein